MHLFHKHVSEGKESDSRAHQTLRASKGNVHGHGANKIHSSTYIEHPSSTGVIYVMDRAAKMGWTYSSEEWGNFGQGAPEVGHIDGAMDKPLTITMEEKEFEYAPVAGVPELRKAVAELYNARYRSNHASKYTADNVCIVPGGRAGLTRIAAVLGDANVGFFLPDYTAYEQLLTIFKRFVPIPTPLTEQDSFRVTPEFLHQEISQRGLGVVVCSNPSNPTGRVIMGDEMKEWIEIAKDNHATLVLDEFYSHYVYTHPEDEFGRGVSAAEHIVDVNVDPVIMVDGLTKNFRLPGWRVCWVVGPADVISSIQAAGSFLDGGANHVLQQAAIPLLEPERVRSDAAALQRHFKMKRDFVMGKLQEMGLKLRTPDATFYIWLDLRSLPEPLNNGLHFFEECLAEKVILVPGIFFDINPGRRRELFHSPFHHYVRLSFGPPLDQLERGLAGIGRVLKKHKVHA
ncbi:aminotransferase [Powellomyces hirtus]|nr:aminotransferase [Powellomyces hirtus]